MSSEDSAAWGDGWGSVVAVWWREWMKRSRSCDMRDEWCERNAPRFCSCSSARLSCISTVAYRSRRREVVVEEEEGKEEEEEEKEVEVEVEGDAAVSRVMKEVSAASTSTTLNMVSSCLDSTGRWRGKERKRTALTATSNSDEDRWEERGEKSRVNSYTGMPHTSSLSLRGGTGGAEGELALPGPRETEEVGGEEEEEEGVRVGRRREDEEEEEEEEEKEEEVEEVGGRREGGRGGGMSSGSSSSSSGGRGGMGSLEVVERRGWEEEGVVEEGGGVGAGVWVAEDVDVDVMEVERGRVVVEVEGAGASAAGAVLCAGVEGRRGG